MENDDSNADPSVAVQVEGNWQTVAALILWKCKGLKSLEITLDEIRQFHSQFGGDKPVIFVNGLGDKIHTSIIPQASADVIVEHDKMLNNANSQYRH